MGYKITYTVGSTGHGEHGFGCIYCLYNRVGRGLQAQVVKVFV